jgi:hypothetical protein
LDKSSSYASVIDLSDGNIASTPKKEGFQGQIRNVYYEKDVVYFSYFYLTEQVDYTKWDVDSDEFADYVNGIEKTDIIRYDMKNNKEEIVWSGSGACEDMNYGYACIKEQTEQAPKAIKLSDGEVIDLGKQFYDCTFTIDDTGIIVSDYDNSKYLFYDFDKKEMTDIGSVNQSDYLMMTAVTDSNYYVSYYLDSDFVLGYISKEDFLKGQLENVSKVKSYNS